MMVITFITASAKNNMRHAFRVIETILCLVVLTAVFSGCQSAPTHRALPSETVYPIEFMADPELAPGHSNNAGQLQDLSGKEYVFSPGDTIDVKFYYTPELNESQVVRPDGKISMQIVGEVMAAGKTPDQLRWLLTKLYASHLKDPEISVVVRSFTNQRIYVGGQVMRPGTIELTNQMTALEAIMEAGGVDFQEAEIHNVVVIRHYKGTRYGYKLNIDPILQGQESRPFFLESKDIVYVPRTEIAKINQWINQHINKIIPETGLTFSHRRGDSVIGIDMTGSY